MRTLCVWKKTAILKDSIVGGCRTREHGGGMMREWVTGVKRANGRDAAVWMTSGEAELQERENQRPLDLSRVKKRSFFLTSTGSPYNFHWKTLTS